MHDLRELQRSGPSKPYTLYVTPMQARNVIGLPRIPGFPNSEAIRAGDNCCIRLEVVSLCHRADGKRWQAARGSRLY